jgi:hypothetical protein
VNSSSSSISIETPSSKNNEFKEISQQEFELALSKTKVEKDEFDGNNSIILSLDNKSPTTVGNSRITLVASMAKTVEDSEWGFALSSAYYGEDWMFHYEINIKSDSGVLNLKDVLDAGREVQDNGKVTEFGLRTLESGEIQQFCKILNSNEIQFRLRGLGGKVSYLTGIMGDQLVNGNRAACIVYAGLLQGLQP